MAAEENPERKRQLGDEATQLHQDREKSARMAAHVTDSMVLQVVDHRSSAPPRLRAFAPSHLRAPVPPHLCTPQLTSTAHLHSSSPHLRR